MCICSVICYSHPPFSCERNAALNPIYIDVFVAKISRSITSSDPSKTQQRLTSKAIHSVKPVAFTAWALWKQYQ